MIYRLWFVFALACALRLGYLFELRGTALLETPIGDGARYDGWARELAAGSWFGTEVFYQAPLYPYFLAVVYKVLGRDLWAVRLLQAVVGSLSCVLVAWSGRRFFDERTGWLAGVLLACYGPAIYFDGLLQKGVFGGLLMSAFLASLALAAARPSVFAAGVVGVVLGLFALARENALLLPPVAGVWLWMTTRRLRVPAALLAGLALVLVPVGLRNQALGGRFLVTTSQAGTNFYIGNHEGADGRYRPLRPGRGGPAYERTDATELAERALGRDLTPAEVSGYWMDRGLAHARERPAAWLGLLLRKAYLVLHAREIMDTDSLEAYREHSWVLAATSRLVHFGWLLPLAIVGAYDRRREWQRLWVLYCVPATMAAAVALFFVMGRYRFPLVPVLALFAAAGILGLVEDLRARNPRRIAGSVGLLLATAVVANVPLSDPVDPRTVTFYEVGSTLLDEGELERAREELERALRFDPGFADAHYRLGEVASRNGDPEEAERSFRAALAVDPGHAHALTGLGGTALDRGDLGEAEARYRAAIAADPELASPRNNLAVLLVRQDRAAEAIEEWERALRVAPADVSVLVNLGKVSLMVGRESRGRELLERALALEPDHAEARRWLTGGR